MEQLKIAQFYNKPSKPRREKSEILKEVDINYCVPDMFPGKKEIRRWAGYTSLHFAVEKYDLDLVHELLRQGADVIKQGTEDGRTPLHAVIHNKYFYKRFDSQEYKNVEVPVITHHLLNSLLSRQVEVNNTLNPKCKNRISHLHIACLVNHTEAVQLFVKANEPLSLPISHKAEYLKGYTPLHCAICSSSVEAADILLRYGADIRVKNAKGQSCVDLLVKRIMDMTDFIKMGKRTLCMPHEEGIERLKSIINLVLKTRAKDRMLWDDTGLSALQLACILRNKSIVEDCLTKGVDVNMPVKSESEFWPAWTPLHFAACSNIRMMTLLMENGANITMRNLEGETPLDLCAKRFTPSDIQLILSKEEELKEIILSDDCTKLSNLLKAMNEYDKFSSFLKKLKDGNIVIPLNSPVWPGYNLLHLSVSLNDKSKVLEHFEEKLDLSKATDAIDERYNCTEEEEALYNKRIELCLRHGCRASMKNANGQTPIHLAFNTDRQPTAKTLLSCNKDNAVDLNGFSHLHIACALGQVDTVKRYLSTGAEVNSRTRISFDCQVKNPIIVRANSTPLHLAVMFNQKNVVECLLDNKADVYAQDSLGLTAIHLSMDVSKSLAKLLFRATPNLRDSLSAAGLSHLHVAVWANDHEAVEKLLLNGAKVDRVVEADIKQLPFLADFFGKTPLLVAKSDKVAKSLLKAGANVHAKDPKGISALQHAMRAMSDEPAAPFMRLLKSGKCKVESCGMTLLHAACGELDLEWAEELLKNGADVNARISDEHRFPNATPMHVLLYQARVLDYNCPELLRFVGLLVDHGADLTSECRGSTPLHLTYEYNYGDALEQNDFGENDFFLGAGDSLLKRLESYDVNPVNNQGFSHFHFACLRNDVEMATKFLDHGVDIDATTDPFADYNGGFTALHFAMAYGCKEIAFLLLGRGADVNAEDAKGNQPLHLAIKRKFVDLPLIEAMLSRGADIHAKNVSGETLLSCLWKYGGLTLERLEFFWNHGGFINVVDTMIAFNK